MAGEVISWPRSQLLKITDVQNTLNIILLVDKFNSVVHHVVANADQGVLKCVGKIGVSDLGAIWEANNLFASNVKRHRVQKCSYGKSGVS